MVFELQNIRKRLHISQTELAEIVGVSLRTVGSWENGKSSPNAEQLRACAEALHCTPNDILGWYVEHPEDKALGFEQDEIAIIENYRECTPQWRTNIAMTARSAASESKNTPKCVLSDEGKQENVA